MRTCTEFRSVHTFNSIRNFFYFYSQWLKINMDIFRPSRAVTTSVKLFCPYNNHLKAVNLLSFKVVVFSWIWWRKPCRRKISLSWTTRSKPKWNPCCTTRVKVEWYLSPNSCCWEIATVPGQDGSVKNIKK